MGLVGGPSQHVSALGQVDVTVGASSRGTLVPDSGVGDLALVVHHSKRWAGECQHRDEKYQQQDGSLSHVHSLNAATGCGFSLLYGPGMPLVRAYSEHEDGLPVAAGRVMARLAPRYNLADERSDIQRR